MYENEAKCKNFPVLEINKSDTFILNIVGAYLFGSYSKGEVDKWSDIDLAILTDKFIGDSFDFTLLLMKIARNIDFNLIFWRQLSWRK